MKGAWAWIAIALVLTVIIVSVAKVRGLEWGDVFSLGQLVVDVILLPAVIIGFVQTAKEFKEAQATPALDLYWSTEDGGVAKELTFELWSRAPSCFRLVPTILNKGSKLALWYTVRFTIPHSLAGPLGISGPADEPRGWRAIVGGNDNWKIGEVRVNHALAGHLFTFMGNGEVGALPGDGLNLASVALGLEVAEQCPERIEVPYSIVTGWEKRVEGRLVLHLRRQAEAS